MSDHFELPTLKALGDLIQTRLILIHTYVVLEEDYDKAFKVVEEIQNNIDNLRHAAEMMRSTAPKTTDGKEEINRMIKIAKRHLGELEDWVHIDKRDAQIKSAYLLTEVVDELQSRIRATK